MAEHAYDPRQDDTSVAPQATPINSVPVGMYKELPPVTTPDVSAHSAPAYPPMYPLSNESQPPSRLQGLPGGRSVYEEMLANEPKRDTLLSREAARIREERAAFLQESDLSDEQTINLASYFRLRNK